jgi:hypothetical protein
LPPGLARMASISAMALRAFVMPATTFVAMSFTSLSLYISFSPLFLSMASSRSANLMDLMFCRKSVATGTTSDSMLYGLTGVIVVIIFLVAI